MMIGQTVPGYRDSAHLYFPLFHWIQQQWNAGTIPFWNPLDDFGQPLVGDAVSSVFYPLKAIFFLNWLPYPARFGIFVALHPLIGAVGAAFLAKRLRCVPAGCVLAGISYALSGIVLFQSNNVIYLVGAAWLPWSLAAGWTALRSGSARAIAGCSITLALMVLGGDPQAAYHALLILALAAIVLSRKKISTEAPINRRQRIGILIVLVASAAALSAVQWIPTAVWQQRSVRSADDSCQSVWQCLGQTFSGQSPRWSDLISPPVPGSHRDAAYQFSQPPWSVIELVWPNISGREFPQFRRWASAIPAADRVWTPSIYFGLATLLLAASAFSLRRGSGRFDPKHVVRNQRVLRVACPPVQSSRTYSLLDEPAVPPNCGFLQSRSGPVVFISWMTFWFALASCGWYGLGWMLGELFPTARTSIAPGLLGPYWWMSTFLPGYASFRYPAKLLVVATLGAALLAGYQIRRLDHRRGGRLAKISLGICLMSVALLCASWLPAIGRMLSSLPGDPLFGPFDVSGSLFDLRVSLAHAAVVAATFAGILIWNSRGAEHRSAAMWGLVVLTCIDLVVANQWLLVQVPESTCLPVQQLTEPSNDRFHLRLKNSEHESSTPWAQTSSQDRLAEIIRSEMRNFHPKYHLWYGVNIVGSFHALEPADLGWFNEIADPKRVLRLPGDAPESTSEPAAKVVPFERLISARRVDFVAAWTPPPFGRRTFLDPVLKSKFQEAVRSDLDLLNQAPPFQNDLKTPRPRLQLRQMVLTPNELTLQVHSPAAGWLILKDYWDPGWRASIQKRGEETETIVPVERFAGIWRAIQLPGAGEFTVRFRYRPVGWTWACWISACGWLVAAWIFTPRPWHSVQRRIRRTGGR